MSLSLYIYIYIHIYTCMHIHLYREMLNILHKHIIHNSFTAQSRMLQRLSDSDWPLPAQAGHLSAPLAGASFRRTPKGDPKRGIRPTNHSNIAFKSL